MGKGELVRLWCGFRGVGCVLGILPNPVVYLAGELCERDSGHTNLGADTPTAIPNMPGWPSGRTIYIKSERKG